MSLATTSRVCVVGAGVSGLSTATQIQTKHPGIIDVTVIAEKISPETTTDGAAGIWKFQALNYVQPRRSFWLKETYERLKELSRMDYAPEIGIFQIQTYDFFVQELVADQEFKDTVMGFRVLTQEELNMYPLNVKSGFTYQSFVIQGALYLSWLTKRFQRSGGKVIKKKIISLSQLAGEYDVVVNCTGLGSIDLIGDKSMVPIRGQVLRVKAPWIKHSIHMDDYLTKEGRCCYIIPQIDSVVIGGTRQAGNASTESTEEDTKHILQITAQFFPSLKNAEIKNVWTGLRPWRPSVRIEKEIIRVTDKYGIDHHLKVVHNYGHGGSGLLLHFGCALDACDLVSEMLQGKVPTLSKL